MKTSAILTCFVAMLFAISAMNIVMAGTLDIASLDVSVNDASSAIVGSPGETIPVRVQFVSNEDITDARIDVWISGYRDDIETSSNRFDVIADRTYVKTLELQLPSVQDIEDLDEELTLHVEISDSNDDYEAQEYVVTVQRDSYAFNLLSVDAPSRASAGDIIAIDVVLKNIGRNGLQDAFVVARIPELDISKRVYFGDIASLDNLDLEDNDADNEDAVDKRIYLVIPSDAESGEYDLEVRAYNYDADAEVVNQIAITGANTSNNETVDDTATDGNRMPTSVIVLTVALVIVFVVLLIVLIVLLTKKQPEKTEDFGETSYY